MEVKIYSVIEILFAWKEKHGDRFSYSFTIDTNGISRYRMSLYYTGEHCSIKGAYSISTNDIDEILEKLQKGLIEL